MESQDTATLFLFKIWPTIEANKKRIVAGVGAIVTVVLVCLFFSWQKDQKEVAAGEAYSKLLISLPGNESSAQLADGYLKVASDYPGTEAAQRAQLQGAADLFSAGNYADAQTQFQKFADTYPTSSMMATAALGIAAALEAQGKRDAAADAYKGVINNYSDLPAQLSAKFALGRIYDQEGRDVNALRYLDEVARRRLRFVFGPASRAKIRGIEGRQSRPRRTSLYPGLDHSLVDAKQVSGGGRRPIEVAAALIFRQGRLLITQRHPEAHLGGLWEFPGGKRDSGESWEDCVIREIREELGVEMVVGALYESITHAYPEKTVHLQFFIGTLPHGEPRPLGCADCRWVTRAELDQFEFPAADQRLLTKLKSPQQVWA